MMRWIVGWSMSFRLLVIPIAAAMVTIGIVRLRGAPVDILPEFSPPQVQIQTEALGLSATEMEQLITVPLEQDFLAGMPWLDEITSESVQGLSSVLMTFKPGTDVLRARQMVQERLSQTFVLPNVSKPPFMIQPVSSTNRAMMIGLSSTTLSPIELSVLARWIIKPKLLGVAGVANVSVFGERDRQLQVLVDPEKLNKAGVTLNQIITTTGNSLWVSPLSFVEASTPGTGGFIESPDQRLGILHISPIVKAKDLAEVVIEDQPTGKQLRLGDVASVVEDHQPLIGDALVNNRPGLIVVVEKFPGANTLEVTRGVEQALDSLRPGLTGVQIDTNVYRPANFIDSALHNLAIALIIGGLLLIAAIGVLFADWRTTLIAVVAVLVSLVTTGLVLQVAGTGLNMMVLAGLVMGLAFVIADAVSDARNVAQRLREHQQSDRGEPAAAVIAQASLDMRGPMAYATLVALLAAVPIFLLPEQAGLLFRPLALAFVTAVLVSMVVALTVTPALAMLLLRNDGSAQRRDSPLLRGPQRWYASMLPRVLGRSRLAYGFAALVVLAGLGVLLQPLGSSTIPLLQDRNVLIRWTAAPGTSAAEMLRLTEQAGRQLRAIPGVSNVGVHVGRAITSDQVVGPNSAEIWVTLDPTAGYGATRAAINSIAAGYPGLNAEAQTYPEQRLQDGLAKAGDDVVVRVYGQDLNVLTEQAKRVQQTLGTVDGLVNVHPELPTQQPTVQVKVDLAKARQFGIKPGDVRRAAAALISGVTAGSLFEDQKVFDVVVWGVPAVRDSLTGVRDMRIDTPKGQVRLGDLADVSVGPTPSVIKHEANSRYIDVGATIKGRNDRAILKEVEDKVDDLTFPLEYHAEVTGNYEIRQGKQNLLLITGAAALIGIYLLLLVSVSGWRLAAVLFLCLLVPVAGGLLAGLITGITALSSLVAVAAVVGIAAHMILQVVGRYRQLEQRDGGSFQSDPVLRGANEQLSPILVTTVATVAALLPLLVFGQAGTEVVRPMIAIILGGLVVSALTALFIVPALYRQFGTRVHRADVVTSAQPDMG